MKAGATLISPLGPLTIWEETGAIVALTWECPPRESETALLHEAKRQLKAYFAGERRKFELPLDPRGTDFQRAVWRMMEEIPYGRTRRYGDIAGDIDTSPRAVGGACGHNPIPILIPCHRVVGKGLALGGYSGGGGIESKRFLLEHEGSIT